MTIYSGVFTPFCVKLFMPMHTARIFPSIMDDDALIHAGSRIGTGQPGWMSVSGGLGDATRVDGKPVETQWTLW